MSKHDSEETQPKMKRKEYEKELRKLQTQVQEAARDFEESVNKTARDFGSGVRAVESQLNAGASAEPSGNAEALPAPKAPIDAPGSSATPANPPARTHSS